MKKILIIAFIAFSISANAQFSLLGVTNFGGANDGGVIFKYTPSTNILTKIFDFNKPYFSTMLGHEVYDTTGYTPRSLILANDGFIYGNTEWGGSCNAQTHSSDGILFKFNPLNNNIKPFMVFADVSSPCNISQYGNAPYAPIMQASDGIIYGTQFEGGGCGGGEGCFFRYNPDSSAYSVIADFGCPVGQASGPWGKLYQALDGKLYGLLEGMASGGNCEIYRYDPATNIYDDIYFSESIYGQGTFGNFTEGDSGKLYALAYDGSIYKYGTIFQYDYTNGTFARLHAFDSINDGSNSTGSLIKASNGFLYGANKYGGLYGKGVFFKFNITTNTLTKLFDFDGTNKGCNDILLIQASDSLIYGVTRYGGIYNKGILFNFNITTNVYTKLFDFDSIHGSNPTYLIQVPDSILTSATSPKIQNNITVYPNPASEEITIEAGDLRSTSYDLRINDIVGNTVLEMTLCNKVSNIDVSSLAKGMYFVKVKTEKGVAVKKFIKE